RRDEGAHDLHVPAMGGRDQRSVVIEADDGARVGAALQSDVDHFEIVVHRRYRENVVALGIERIRIGAQPQERLRRAVLAQERGTMQRGAAVGILNIQLFALTDQPLDFHDVPAGSGVVQAGVDTQLPFAWWSLRKACRAAKLDRAKDNQSKTGKASRHCYMDRSVGSPEVVL